MTNFGSIGRLRLARIPRRRDAAKSGPTKVTRESVEASATAQVSCSPLRRRKGTICLRRFSKRGAQQQAVGMKSGVTPPDRASAHRSDADPPIAL